eukprot:11181836-Lingulodinium_polyedra.AAC.1
MLPASKRTFAVAFAVARMCSTPTRSPLRPVAPSCCNVFGAFVLHTTRNSFSMRSLTALEYFTTSRAQRRGSEWERAHRARNAKQR